MGAISEQGIFGIVCAVLGLAGGIYLSRMLRSRYGIGARNPDTKPPVYVSRQDMRRAERVDGRRNTARADQCPSLTPSPRLRGEGVRESRQLTLIG